MRKPIAYAGIILAILLFLSFAMMCAVWGNARIFTMIGTGEGKQYSIILEDGEDQQMVERNIEINLFDRPDAGRINVISPNAQGRGTIHLQNTSQTAMRYTLHFDDENKLDVPIFFRVRNKNNEVIMGSEESWLSLDKLEIISSDLDSGDQTQYVIEWTWISDSDLADTQIGIMAQTPSEYKLAVDIYAKPIGYLSNHPKLAANTDIISVILAVLLTGAIGTISYMICKNKKPTKQNKNT